MTTEEIQNGPKKELTYALTSEGAGKLGGIVESAKEFSAFIKGDGLKLTIGLFLVLVNSVAGIVTPYLVAQAIDKYISTGNLAGLTLIVFQLIGLYLVTLVAGYFQGNIIGFVSQRTLFRLRQKLFEKLQELPIAFFNQNKAGDLMSRINNDTDKLNQFLSETIARFAGSFFVIFGIAVFVLVINFKLALVMLSATVFLVIITRVLSPLLEKLNKKSLGSVGSLSASLQENLTNFRVIIAYSKRQYFRNLLETINKSTFKTTFKADASNRVFEPIYDFAGGAAIFAVLMYGLHLISIGQLSLGVLIAFVAYTGRFYDPLRFLATLFGSIQVSMAAWSRVRAVFNMKSDLDVIEAEGTSSTARLELQNLSFGYEGGGLVIEDANLIFEAGKTYALVGPTGGGKSTLASLMSRLYDPLSGKVLLSGKDMRSYDMAGRADQVSVILQDPILFSGTVGDNIRYGNEKLAALDDVDLDKLLRDRGFSEVLSRFDQGLSTPVSQSSGSGLSLGQKQLISFMRAILRQPKLLILDEATANIDTVTEAMLNKALEVLPKDTTKVIIAHRLNTIKEADEIMFVNGHHVTRAGSFDDAIKLIESSKRSS